MERNLALASKLLIRLAQVRNLCGQHWDFATIVLFSPEVLPFINMHSKANVISPQFWPTLPVFKETLSFSVSNLYTSVCQFYF